MMSEQPLDKKIKLWEQSLFKVCSNSFEKIRKRKNHHSSHKINSKLSSLIEQRNLLMSSEEKNKAELNLLEQKIHFLEASENMNFIKSTFFSFHENQKKFNINEMWRQLDKLCPKFNEETPIAKYNHFGTLITDSEEIKEVLSLEFKQRF